MTTEYQLISIKLQVKLDFIKKKENLYSGKINLLAGFNWVGRIRGNKVIFYFGQMSI